MKKRTTVATWLNDQFLTWMNQEQEHKTITAFAEYLEVDRNLLGQWLNGRIVPSNANVIRIANKFGPEIYDLLEWPRPINQEKNRH